MSAEVDTVPSTPTLWWVGQNQRSATAASKKDEIRGLYHNGSGFLYHHVPILAASYQADSAGLEPTRP
jgi:hypothetical protein